MNTNMFLFKKFYLIKTLMTLVIIAGMVLPATTTVIAQDEIPVEQEGGEVISDGESQPEPLTVPSQAETPVPGEPSLDGLAPETIVTAVVPVATETVVVTPPPMVVAPTSEEDQEKIQEILETAAENEITVADSEGNPLPLATNETMDLLTTGDPFFFDGTKWVGYTVDGTGCPVNVECHAELAGMGPLESAVSLAPAGSTIYVASGTYAEDVSINTVGLSMVAFNSIVVPDANTNADLKTVGGFTSGFALIDTLRLYKDFGTTDGVFATNIFVYGENSTGSDGIAPSYGPTNTNSGRLADALNLVNVSDVNATIEANLEIHAANGYYNVWDVNDHSTDFEWDCGEPQVFINPGLNYRMILKNPFNADVIGYYTANPDERPLNLSALERMEDLILGASMSEQTVNGWGPWNNNDEKIVYWNLLGHVNGVGALTAQQQAYSDYITAGTNDATINKLRFWWLWPIASRTSPTPGSLSPLNTQFTFLKYNVPSVSGCSDPEALNYNPNANGQGVCEYTPICEDDSALNFGEEGECVFAPVCEDETALNFGEEGDCRYPTTPLVCNDPAANNFGAAGACTYSSGVPLPVLNLFAPVGGFIPVTGARIIVAGLGHTCMTVEEGKVVCWGLNSSGQDGEGTWTNQLVPAYVKNLSGVVDLTAGSLHTCALRGEGDVWCWGDNTYGQLGNGTMENSNIPVMVQGLPGKVTSFTGGQDFTCAKVESSEVYCWGRNDQGQLNDGTTENKTKPVKSGFTKALNEFSGGQTVLVGETTGEVDEWSENQPLSIGDIRFAVGISGNRFAPGGCSVTAAGTVHCWGQEQNSTPVEKANSAMMVAAGMTHGCAVNLDNTVSCWGENQFGQLGNGTNENNPSAVLVKDLGDVGQLAVGAHHACILFGEGDAAKCWGWNEYGQLGNNSLSDSNLPVLVYPPAR